MNFTEGPRAADSAIDQRLDAAADALREASATQVDATTALRVILLHGDPVPWEPDPQPAPSPNSPATSLLRGSQRRLALAVNLLLVLALGVGFLIGVQRGQDNGQGAPAPTVQATTAVPPSTVTVPQTVSSVPEQCIKTAELADEVISRLNRNVRDERLFLALRDYTIASQACRREAAP
ncbi:MAG TPA: hypothetical protein VJ735_20210 [Actinomycetes bacterium]|nr:hypothetical protein [Actinomycetes bacterium]